MAVGVDQMTEMRCHRHGRRQIVVVTTATTAVTVVVVNHVDCKQVFAHGEIFTFVAIPTGHDVFNRFIDRANQSSLSSKK